MFWTFLFFTGVAVGDSISTSLLTRWPSADLKSKYKISSVPCVRISKTTSKEDGGSERGGGGMEREGRVGGKEGFRGWEV